MRVEDRERTGDDGLELSDERVRLLLEKTHIIPWEADATTWRFTYVGSQAVKILGYPLERWYERDFWTKHIHPDDRDRAVRFCLNSSSQSQNFEFEYRMIAADGSHVWIHDIVSVDVADGAASTLRGFMIDVSERVRAEEESRRHRDELAHVARVATMGELAASIAHELNQPLCAILSNAQAGRRFLERNEFDRDELRALLLDIAEDGKRAGEVIRRLRALLRKGKLERRPLDVNKTVRQVAKIVRSDAVARHVVIRLELENGLPPVEADRIQIQQVLLNLILNSFDAMGGVESDSRELVVRTSREDGDTIAVAVRDSGTGLDPEQMDRIFDAFFTTKPGGMGMGLSINRSIIDSHGGRLWAVQNTGSGATFQFTLPACPSPIRSSS